MCMKVAFTIITHIEIIDCLHNIYLVVIANKRIDTMIMETLMMLLIHTAVICNINQR